MNDIHHASSEIDQQNGPARQEMERIGSSFSRSPDSLAMRALRVVLISHSAERRRAIADALSGAVQATIAREVADYPDVDDAARLVHTNYDVVLVDIDGDSERALDLVETLCAANSSITVMVVSSRAESELLVRCMRAGAREFLAEPIPPNILAEAFIRASARRQETRVQKKTTGKILMFLGAKGGSGTTTVSTNFAVALAKVSGANIALLDLHLELGEAALMLGITPQFSVSDALENIHRLDSDFLSTLLSRHSSGVSLLAAPDKFSAVPASRDGIEKLLLTLRGDFPYVVIDAGPSLSSVYDTLFETADTVYLVTQVNLPELRNANRLITRYFSGDQSNRLEIVLNRFAPRGLEVDENSLNKALTRPAKWKVPNEYIAVRRSQNAGAPLALEDTAVSRALFEMARSVCGQSAPVEKKRRFGLFG
jgi:pilus assembly protein CpaE